MDNNDNSDESSGKGEETKKSWSGTPFHNDDVRDKRNIFWKSTPQEYATAQTDGLDENKKLVAYPLAYLYRSLFSRKFWMFALVGLIIFISFKSIITNDF